MYFLSFSRIENIKKPSKEENIERTVPTFDVGVTKRFSQYKIGPHNSLFITVYLN